MAKTEDMLAKLEPEAEAGLDPHHAMLASIAISLKRIADILGDGRIGGLNYEDAAERRPSLRNRDARTMSKSKKLSYAQACEMITDLADDLPGAIKEREPS